MLEPLRRLLRAPAEVLARLERIQQTLGRIEGRQTHAASSLAEAEFQVSSQWGDDGIIQYLLRRVPVERELFVEFGVQDYTEANTRFLLQNNNWNGLVLDGSPDNIERIKCDPIFWRHNLKAECAFIDRDNIDGLLQRNGVAGDIGLLSIDIDGNDYWVWEAIASVKPRIVVIEYNSLFGPSAAITVPYRADFNRTRAHYSNLYWGASIGALGRLGRRKGYRFVGSNRAGNNAFFVRDDVAGDVPEASVAESYVPARFRESRSAGGELTYLDAEQGLALIGDLPVIDVSRESTVTIRDALGLV